MKQVFWDRVCSFDYSWELMLKLTIVFLVLQVIPLPFLDRGSATYYISWLGICIGLIAFAGLTYLVRRCAKRDR